MESLIMKFSETGIGDVAKVGADALLQGINNILLAEEKQEVKPGKKL